LAAACRQALDDLTAETYIEALCYQVDAAEWEAFVRRANEAGEYEYFPKVFELRRDIDDARKSSTAISGLLPSDTRTKEQRQADAIETSRRLREIVGAEPPKWPTAKSAPGAEPIKVNVTDERLAELRAQAERIKLEEGAKAS
jgi:hypothetical protein